MSIRIIFVAACTFVLFTLASIPASAQECCHNSYYGQGVRPISPEPGWAPHIFAPASERQRIKAMDIEQRPYRPLHFYGNTVRRSYYRGGLMPRYNSGHSFFGRY